MAKEIQYPSKEWIESWIDKWMNDNPTKRIFDFSSLEEEAKIAWWDKQIDMGNPTPFDMTTDEKKAQKAITKGMAKSDKERKTSTRERKPNEEKQFLISNLAQFLTGKDITAVISNAEKSVDFSIGNNNYTFTLTCHRPKKE